MSAIPYFEAIAVEAWLGSRPVFQDLSLTLRLGEPTVLLGPNGAGKSAWMLRRRKPTKTLIGACWKGCWIPPRTLCW